MIDLIISHVIDYIGRGIWMLNIGSATHISETQSTDRYLKNKWYDFVFKSSVYNILIWLSYTNIEICLVHKSTHSVCDWGGLSQWSRTSYINNCSQYKLTNNIISIAVILCCQLRVNT